MTFADLLTGLTSGVLTVPAVSFILNQWLSSTTANRKAIVAYAASFALGTIGWFLLTWYRQIPLPETPQLFIDALWPVWFAAYGASQAVLRVAKTIGVVQKETPPEV